MKIKGIVVNGKALGRKLGFPTANVDVKDNLEVRSGVYAVRVSVDDQTFSGMANLGVRPSVAGSHRRFLEVNIFDFEGNLYGKLIEVDLVKFMREEAKFASLDDLKDAIAEDKRVAVRFFSENNNN